MDARKVVIPRTGKGAKFTLVNAVDLTLSPHQIRIKAESCGVAFADVLMREGLYPDVERRDLTPGYDVVGRVIEIAACRGDCRELWLLHGDATRSSSLGSGD
ncbi:MAG: hypothetical protein MI976_21140 [Pseudomonadales bacterium]|nr:hypothetical protein [Pseudomonadales bacterium]